MKLIYIVVFVLSIINYINCAIPGCFESSTGCYTYCSDLMGTCSSPFKEITETRSNGGSVCYCYRPYTDEELNIMNAGECERYSNQCLGLSLASTSCANALKYCDKDKNKELCVRGIKLENVQKNLLGYYCMKRGIIDQKGNSKY